jgi:hypothetical protein
MTKSIDDLLRDALDRHAAATPPTRCLDAETAAAFGDDTLPAGERATVEAHIADCARCQALLASLVRITPPPAAPAWWRRPAIAWLAPLAVAATALIVWINVPHQTSFEPPVLSSRDVTPSAQPDSSRGASAAAGEEPRPQALRELTKAMPAPAPAPAAKRERDRAAPSKDVPAETQPDAMANSLVAPPPPAAAPTPAPPAAASPAAAAPPVAAAPTVARSAAPAAAAAVPGTASPAAAAEQRTADARLPSTPLPPAAIPPRNEVSEPLSVDTLTVTTESIAPMAARRFDAAREPIIFSSNPISRWRIGRSGVVQHSADGGSTWQTQSTGVNVTLTAGSSPSPAVCWLVGPAGVVLISTDEGSSWQRLAFPVTTDLVSVRATDTQRATVVTSDGRTFTTSDRGHTWR